MMREHVPKPSQRSQIAGKVGLRPKKISKPHGLCGGKQYPESFAHSVGRSITHGRPAFGRGSDARFLFLFFETSLNVIRSGSGRIRRGVTSSCLWGFCFLLSPRPPGTSNPGKPKPRRMLRSSVFREKVLQHVLPGDDAHELVLLNDRQRGDAVVEQGPGRLFDRGVG